MQQTDWFEAILHAEPTGEEMTSLVTIQLPAMQKRSVRLDWWIHTGGFLRRKWDDDIRAVEGACLQIGMRPDPVLVAEFGEWLASSEKNFPLKGFSFSTSSASRETWTRAVPLLGKLEWKELSIEALASVGSFPKISDSALVEKFKKEIERAGVDLQEPPWVLWSRFVPWASRFKNDLWFDLDTRLTFLRCALSPQDERSENESLDPDFIMVNPTFETVERPKDPKFRDAPLVAYSRNFDEVHHRELTMLEAAVLDQVRESFRAKRMEAIASVAGEMRIQKEFVDSAISILIEDGYLLGKSGRIARGGIPGGSQ